MFGLKITSSGEEGQDDGDSPPSPRTPSRRAQLKRKRGKEFQAVQRKRPRRPPSDVVTDDDDDQNEKKQRMGNKAKHDFMLDPTRKYCSGKLREVLVPIFVQFANAPQASDGQGREESTIELDEVQRKKAEEDGAAYVLDLEQCLFETYGELDKRGHKAAAAKYK